MASPIIVDESVKTYADLEKENFELSHQLKGAQLIHRRLGRFYGEMMVSFSPQTKIMIDNYLNKCGLRFNKGRFYEL